MKNNTLNLLYLLCLVICLVSQTNSLNVSKLLSKVKTKYFWQSGNSFRIEVSSSSGWLYGNLLNSVGSSVSASFNLNNNIGNIEGMLVWGSGGFAGSCDNCSLTSTYYLKCDCLNSTGSRRTTSVNLKIENSNGSFKYNPAIPTSYEDLETTNYDPIAFTFNAISEQFPVTLDDLSSMARGEILTSGLNALTDSDAKRKFKKFPAEKKLKLGSFVGNVMTAIDILTKVVDYFWGTAVKGGRFIIQNSTSNSLIRNFESEYQTDKWKGQFPYMVWSGETKEVYIEASNCAFKSCSDTGAETEYSLDCNGRKVKFQLRIKGRDTFFVFWNEDSKYNECYDIRVTAEWRLKRTDTENQKISNALVVGNFGTPWNGNSAVWNPYMKVEIINHIKGARFPLLFEDCDYKGSILPMGNNDATAVSNLGLYGLNWNDRASSIRIPPGFKVMLFSDDMFRGTRKIYDKDTSCFSDFNDKATSYILVSDDEASLN